ncbi:RagB/SusD family nutrient uptake outer membrane protein [Bacteroides sp. 51]|uniref:RagB/SusD family nutrient uptake outer membrane protein n=1 Tax=Bacteroides sp. 51 TaxID=2302938 RepID=UPI0013D1E0C8|nr:RagB/SusD family nutrient uptake outer membrane protein [Bacteroides sp. 51]NDV81720.1 RagB/SusD family nutrient uptake outer membrane protein [Bacteroides sp. 51]
MKTIKYIVLALALAFVSCEGDFLDRKPIDFLAPDSFNSEKDIKEAVNGIYRAFLSNKLEPIYLDFMVDNGFMADYRNMFERVYDNETNFVVNKWSWNYKIILRANTVLHFIDNVSMQEATYNQYKGEAMFLRALAYSDLLIYYGSAPLRTEPEGLEGANKELSSREQLTEFVLKELKDAAELLPPTYAVTDRGRATKGAALAIKARVLLFNKRYSEVIAACEEVRALGVYQIMPDYKTLFLPEGEANNKEVIFDKQHETNSPSSIGLSNDWYTYFYSWFGYQSCLGLYEQFYSTNGKSIKDPTNTLYDDKVLTSQIVAPSTFIKNGGFDTRFQNRDPRMNATLVVPYTVDAYDRTSGAPWVYYPKSKGSANFTSFRIRKYVDYSNNGVAAISGTNPVIIRYADVLLMEAEAYIERALAGGEAYDDAHVRSLIDQVRQRESVKMPKVENAEGKNLAPEKMREILRHERRVEFAFEGLRLFDVIRWDDGANAFTDFRGYNPGKLGQTAADGVVYEEVTVFKRTFDPSKGYLWPIPKTETDSNKAIN